MRTLIATVMYNSKGNDIYCAARKVSDKEIDLIRMQNRKDLENLGFDFIKLLSLEHPNVKGHAIFFEGHLDEMAKVLKSLNYGY